MMWEVEPEGRTQDTQLPERAQLHRPSFIGSEKTGYVQDEVELCLALLLGQERAEGKSR